MGKYKSHNWGGFPNDIIDNMVARSIGVENCHFLALGQLILFQI